ncbi:UDP-N-acetylmuramate dehydrogenase [Granulicella mallensis]|uniref:UDP-N-acetylenolpyruvoylglucosamine reductase n=1 Tax=Granulicella mallensis (strain ATCC BAA-1857 / DSM 23137 / MP5ACTX8) TaxID=682795 RepID=G8P165_GRAMM|nr:UDP-N-acetylmuramate dehydrogenase [Granulicella mallensis]AEU36989.1 UDP-N-acetylenolpyruvoylglucosamine reductase [Granulicella mallensis MP5ACTX8]
MTSASLPLREDVPLAPLTTFRIGGPARYFAEATTEQEVAAAVAWAEAQGVELFLLGGGSNLLVHDEGFAGLVLQMKIAGIEALGDGVFEVGAGESWDGFVARAVAAECAGIECLAGIPGSVGGTPVQNVGAYGQEVSETIVSVRAFDRQAKAFVDLSKQECRFRYRASLFNTDARGRYIVTRVRFQLRAGGVPTLRYADLQKHFADAHPTPSLVAVAAAVREIRRAKGMLIVEGDPDCRSAGSFFKNPVVAASLLPEVAKAVGGEVKDVPSWPAGEGCVKLPAAWLLERAGFVKGYGVGPAGISTRHTLALTNRGGATFADVEHLEEEIVAGVEIRFGIRLEREPVVLG